jgi:hypothetical protein
VKPRPTALPVIARNIPADLKAWPQWVVWRYEWDDDLRDKVTRQRTGEWTKPPRSVRGGGLASSTEPLTWASFDDVATAYAGGSWDGVGFCPREEDGFVFTDWDDMTTDEARWTGGVVQLDSYTERSPSGTGYRVILRGRLVGKGRTNRAKGVEIYDRGHYLTITGQHVEGTPWTIEARPERILELHELLSVKPSGNGHRPEVEIEIGDDEVVRRARGERFDALYDNGDLSENNDDHSAADQSLCNLLARYTTDAEQIDRLFRSSALNREKWEARPGYREVTIEKAIEFMVETRAADVQKIALKATLNKQGADGEYNEYRMDRDGTYLTRTPAKGDPYEVQLANFAARIIRKTAADDGLDQLERYDVRVWAGGRIGNHVVKASEFEAMRWPRDVVGLDLSIAAGPSARDHVRAAIDGISGHPAHATIYTHAGWRKIGDRWVFLHADGAIGAEGVVANIDVELPGPLQAYALPPPAVGEDLRAAIRASLGLVDVGPDTVTIPLLAQVYRAPLRHAHLVVHETGRTSSGKSALACVMVGHFAPGLTEATAGNLFRSTTNHNESLLFHGMDMVVLLDEFSPRGSGFKRAEMRAEFGALVRAVAAGTGRGRSDRTGEARVTRPARASMLSTGEELASELSEMARIVVVTVEPGNVDGMGLEGRTLFPKLTAAQAASADGVLAGAMAGYLKWLAAEMEHVPARTRELVNELRAKFVGGHQQTATRAAELMAGMTTFCRFAVAAGAITEEELMACTVRAQAALQVVASGQRSMQVDTDPVAVFVELLQSAIASGRAHLASPTGGVPEGVPPPACGWRRIDGGVTFGGISSGSTYQAQGDRVGWVDGDDLFLDPAASYRAAQGMVSAGENGISVQPKTLGKRLASAGALRSDSGRNTTKRTIEGSRKRAWCLRLDFVFEK